MFEEFEEWEEIFNLDEFGDFDFLEEDEDEDGDML
jgi:hypothetical protein